jgi:cyclic beta-1,2-glucan synthetase
LLSIDRLDERALALAADLTVDPNPRRRSSDIIGRFEDNVRVLRTAYRTLAADGRAGHFLVPAADWLLDNFPLISAELTDIRRNLPRTYARALPVLASPEHHGLARVYVMALELIRHSDSRLDENGLVDFLTNYQRIAPLTIGELWAWPSMLKLALVENLRRLADELLDARDARHAAHAYLATCDRTQLACPLPTDASAAFLVELLHALREYGVGLPAIRLAVDDVLTANQTGADELIRGEMQRQGVSQASVANVITSLRLCATMDWQDFVEAVSLVEQVLRRDPSGAYRRMDFLSRDAQRRAIEAIAPRSGDDQVRAAHKAIETARAAAAAHGHGDRTAHVGFHLVDHGRPALEVAFGHRPRIGTRLRRALRRFATPLYLGAIVGGTTPLLVAVVLYARLFTASVPAQVLVALVMALPLCDLVITTLHALIPRLLGPARLPRLDYSVTGVPDAARCMVVVPTMLTSHDGVDGLLEHMEVLALGNLDPCIHFAILSDFADAPTHISAADAGILDRARRGVIALNAKLGPEHANRFYLFHRDRQWNESEQTWMGWERKRGKIEEFNRVLRQATDTSITMYVGDADLLPLIRYCLTLDSDTRLPRDAAKRLIGIMAHPLNQAVVDPDVGRVTEGYGILQPRVSVTMASATGSWFAQTYAGHTGVDPYTTAVSDVYQDLFDEGLFTGKGLYDVDAFTSALRGRVPENSLLSHDLFEGLFARTALITDVEVVDDYPSNVLAHSWRAHRWVRGDWQILGWLFPWVRSRDGLVRNTLPLLSRWKIFDNLRRSLLAPATIMALIAGWTVLPGHPGAWTALVLGTLAFPLISGAGALLRGARLGQAWGPFLRTRSDDLTMAAARVAVQITFLVHDAARRLHAIGITLTRLLITRRRLLEWEPAADGASRSDALGVTRFIREMASSPITGLVIAGTLLAARPSALGVAWWILVLWIAAPLVAYALSRPVPRRRVVLSDPDRAYLLDVARRTWGYFEAFTVADDHHLPPDNVQVGDTMTVAHRTSPTNIGLGMLAALAANDLGFISRDVLVSRLEATMDTIDQLEKYEGHLLNWYDTRTLAPLAPRYVSTVDSGNLAGALVTLSEGLRPFAPDLARRMTALFDGMRFTFLLNPARQLFAIGFRLPDDERPGRPDASHYDLLASEARLASFLAIAKGDVPERHWFRLGRPTTSVRHTPVLLSWSATLFEYLMPLLVMRSYPGTLLDESCHLVIRRQIDYATAHGVPWGISESAYNLVDRHGDYQYKAFGIPGLGLKRGLGDEVVVSPYSTALAIGLAPTAGLANFRRLAAAGLDGAFGFMDAIDYTPRESDPGTTPVSPTTGVVVRSYMAHHQGMTMVALANVLLSDRMVNRFHADTRVQATELLLQERIPRDSAIVEPRPIDHTREAVLAPARPVRRFRTPHTRFPHTQFLSNGHYVTSITQAGGGASVWRELPVTRSRRDATRDADGQFIYLRDVRSGAIWSATYQPTRLEPDSYDVTFAADRATFLRRDQEISTRLDIAVATEDDVEIRRLTVRNLGVRPREIDVTSYAEVVLTSAQGDFAHPAFGKLFVETEYHPHIPALICHRRVRDPKDTPAWLFHALSMESRPQGSLEWETDRARFLGRGRTTANPQALDGRALSGTTGIVLDPIVSLRQRIRLGPGASVRLSFATGMATDRDTVEALARKYHDPPTAARVFGLALAHAESSRYHLSVSTDDAVIFERLASRVLGTDGSLKTTPDVRAASTLGQSGLWRFAISGDLPIVLVRVRDEADITTARQVLRAQEYWRLKGLRADVVVINEHTHTYYDDVHARLAAMMTGGAFLLRGDQIGAAEQVLFDVVAAAVLRGDLRSQLDRPYMGTTAPVALIPTRLPPATSDATESPVAIRFDRHNGFGGVPRDGRGYGIALERDNETPMPWANVIANPNFGTIVTTSGAAQTWSGNSRENRLTPFANDPISDPTSEAIYLRDDDTGEAWSPTPGPMPRTDASGLCVVTHTSGCSRFERATHGVSHTLDVFVHASEPVKFSRLALTNTSNRSRRISVFCYAEWMLGPPREGDHLHVITEVDEAGAIFARNPFNRDFPDRVAFVASSAPVTSWTGSRVAFLGRHGDVGDPAALRQARLSNDTGPGLDPCAALQVTIDLGAGETRELVFVLGEGRDHAHAAQLRRTYAHPEAASLALTAAEAAWQAMLTTVQVRTPDDSFDTMMNGWLLYQTLSCRVWTRSGYYQPGGAFGFRDQLQDVMALLLSRPDLTRAHILRAASRQFVEGDVQHWWHEPTGRGLRTRCSDDMLWLPYVTAEYIKVTGDLAILDERVPFLVAPPLPPDAHEVYGEPGVADQDGSLYEHCVRAIARGTTAGTNGLPLIGSCDWNDGMNRVGPEGRGESVWLGFFLHTVLHETAGMADGRLDAVRAVRYRADARRLAVALDQAWDGAWYRRGYYDDGTPLGSAVQTECRIDSIAQSWAVLSEAVPRRKAEQAMDAVRSMLIDRGSQVIMLLTPPFDSSAQEPGYIKGYPPGVRENGGQYSHAAAWVVMALAKLGGGDEVMEMFHLLNPLNHTRSTTDALRYQAEPYVLAGDVYSRAPHAGRAGWSWYTGSAAWMYRAGLERILGLRRRGSAFTVAPCIPASWPGFSMTWRVDGATYEIEVENPDRVCEGVAEVLLDGTPCDPERIALLADGRTHVVRVMLGSASGLGAA